MTIVNPELVKHWETEGFSRAALAGYGNSFPFFQRLFSSNEIPWQAAYNDSNLMPYQKELLDQGGYLYYAYPFVNHLGLHCPQLASRLHNQRNVDLSAHVIHRMLKNAAGDHAILHHFELLTGIKYQEPDEIVTMAYLLFPELARRFKKDKLLEKEFYFFTDQAAWTEPPVISLATVNISLPRLKKILSEAIARRGVILYYNQEILNHKLIAGHESEYEIIIHTEKPLTAHTISGIKILSEPDRKDLQSLIGRCK